MGKEGRLGKAIPLLSTAGFVLCGWPVWCVVLSVNSPFFFFNVRSLDFCQSYKLILGEVSLFPVHLLCVEIKYLNLL